MGAARLEAAPYNRIDVGRRLKAALYNRIDVGRRL
jgi:hypothetical protein